MQIIAQKIDDALSRLDLCLDQFAAERQCYFPRCHSQWSFCALRHPSVNARLVISSLESIIDVARPVVTESCAFTAPPFLPQLIA